MRNVTIAFDQPQMCVNGHVFDLHVSDMDIYDRALEMQTKYKTLTGNDPKKTLAAIKRVCAFVDEILGEGAMRTISDGKPVSIHKALDVMVIIAREASASYAERLKDELA